MPFAQQVEVRAAFYGIGAQSAHLENHVGGLDHTGAVRFYPGAFGAIFLVAEPGFQPAEASTMNSTPLFAKTSMAFGTMATRRSPGNVSRMIPIFIGPDGCGNST